MTAPRPKQATLEEPKGAQALPEGASYADAIRRHDFQTAARLIDAAPESERTQPEVRYARARVALALDDVATALEQITDLEQSPQFAGLAREAILEAAHKTQDVTVLEHLLSRSGQDVAAVDRFRLLAAYEVGGQQRRALDGYAELIATLRAKSKPTASERDLLAQLTRRRADLLVSLEQPRSAAADFRWLATEMPTQGAAEHADQHAERLGAAPLAKKERLSRARAFSEEGKVEMTREELRRLARAPGAGVSEQETLDVLAWAIYVSRSDYSEAARSFSAAAAKPGPDKSRLLYYSAKSWARADDHEASIAGYKQVAVLGGPYADHASYQIPRLLFIDGKWSDAVKAYESYLRKYARGMHRDQAMYELAVARLSARSFDAARRDLTSLVKKTKNSRERARLIQLEGVAAEGQGDWTAARALYEKAIADRPLSFSALLAAARLEAKGVAPPPPLPAGPPDTAPRAPLLVALPDLPARLDRVGFDARAEQALEAEEAAIRARYADRGLEALCGLYGQLAFAKRRYQVAQTAATWQTLSHIPTNSNRWQWECVYPTPHLPAVQQKAELRRVPVPLVYAVMRQESAFRPLVVSSASAVGLMQIIPSTARQIAAELGTSYDPDLMTVPAVNIRFGTYYLRRLLDIFADRPELAAASYNAGPNAVSTWLRAGQSLPLDVFVARIPYQETRNYVYRVMGNYARYSYLRDGTLPEISLTLPNGLTAPEGSY